MSFEQVPKNPITADEAVSAVRDYITQRASAGVMMAEAFTDVQLSDGVLTASWSEQAVVAHCKAKDIGISSLGKIPTGGVRLVCMSSDGAERIRAQLKPSLMKADTENLAHGPGWDFVPRP